MPTYDYVCTSCSHQWEEIQKISENPLETCPKCHGATAKRQISGGNFILKGGGWYADLYSSTPKKSSSEGSGGSGGSGGTAASSSSSATSSSSSSTSTASTSPSPGSTASTK